MSELLKSINETITPWVLKEKSSHEAKLADFSIEEVQAAIPIAKIAYFKFDAEGKPTQESVEKFLQKLPGVIFNRKKRDEDPELFEFITHLTKGLPYPKSPWQRTKVLHEITTLRRSGLDIKVLYSLSLGVKTWAEMTDKVNNLIADRTLIGD